MGSKALVKLATRFSIVEATLYLRPPLFGAVKMKDVLPV